MTDLMITAPLCLNLLSQTDICKWTVFTEKICSLLDLNISILVDHSFINEF